MVILALISRKNNEQKRNIVFKPKIILNHYGRKSINDAGNKVQSKKMGEEYKEDRTCMLSSLGKLYY